MFIEVYKVKEFFYRIIDRFYRLFGKGRYFINCGSCDRVNGKMMCLSERMSKDGNCSMGECYLGWIYE
jgi:tRNA U34 2-thiouridine synthase MnmA/TrmU